MDPQCKRTIVFSPINFPVHVHNKKKGTGLTDTENIQGQTNLYHFKTFLGKYKEHEEIQQKHVNEQLNKMPNKK